MKAEKLIGVIIIAFSAFMYYQADRLPPPKFGTLGAAVFPKIVLTLLMLAGGSLILQNFLKGRRAAKAPETLRTQKITSINQVLGQYQWVILAFFCFFAYVLLMDFAGYAISTFIFIPTLMWLIGPRTKSSLAVIAVTTMAMTFGVYYGFKTLFNVFLPAGRLF
ncbi:MAG: tripartite tricarboxylate transporter TctB family protein [Deltaproteobacteria bacterium]|nr:tripartite tricarboxylate transporter TctB family protein [Deltaproteobacteria bacterium]